jgi:hypothetical protein
MFVEAMEFLYKNALFAKGKMLDITNLTIVENL